MILLRNSDRLFQMLVCFESGPRSLSELQCSQDHRFDTNFRITLYSNQMQRKTVTTQPRLAERRYENTLSKECERKGLMKGLVDVKVSQAREGSPDSSPAAQDETASKSFVFGELTQ